MSKAQEIKDAFKRFKYYRDNFDSVYIYPNYYKDLSILLDFIESDIKEWEETEDMICR